MKALLSLTLLSLLAATSRAATMTYTSQGPHSLHDGPAFFVLTIDVSGLVEPVAEMNVTFSSLFHPHPADIDALLVGPAGQNVMLMSDVGELLSETDSIIQDVNLTFRDGASLLPPNVRIASGSYAPTNYLGVIEDIAEMDQTPPTMPPVGPYGTTLSVFNGSNANGTWKLFIQDDLEDESGQMQSWSLTVTTVPEPNSAFLLLAGASAMLVRRRRALIS